MRCIALQCCATRGTLTDDDRRPPRPRLPLCDNLHLPWPAVVRAVYDEEDYQDDVLSAGGHPPQEAKLRRNASAFLERVPVAPGGYTNAANVLVDNIERKAFQSAGVKRVAAKFRRLRERAVQRKIVSSRGQAVPGQTTDDDPLLQAVNRGLKARGTPLSGNRASPNTPREGGGGEGDLEALLP